MRLSDPRFITWLRTTSGNEVRLASEPMSDSGGVAIPLMAGAGLAGGLLMALTLARRKRKQCAAASMPYATLPHRGEKQAAP